MIIEFFHAIFCSYNGITPSNFGLVKSRIISTMVYYRVLQIFMTVCYYKHFFDLYAWQWLPPGTFLERDDDEESEEHSKLPGPWSFLLWREGLLRRRDCASAILRFKLNTRLRTSKVHQEVVNEWLKIASQFVFVPLAFAKDSCCAVCLDFSVIFAGRCFRRGIRLLATDRDSELFLPHVGSTATTLHLPATPGWVKTASSHGLCGEPDSFPEAAVILATILLIWILSSSESLLSELKVLSTVLQTWLKPRHSCSHCWSEKVYTPLVT